MQEYEKAVFISYAWGGESEEIVNQIDQALQQRGLKIIRDKQDLGYKGSISAFMERVGQGNCVIVVISDKYLRSPTAGLLALTVASNPNVYRAPGQSITFTYLIMNSGTATLGPAQFIVEDQRFPSPINCGPDTTSLAPNQSVTCSAVYVTTQEDTTTGQIVSNATASGAGVATSQPALTTIHYSP